MPGHWIRPGRLAKKATPGSLVRPDPPSARTPGSALKRPDTRTRSRPCALGGLAFLLIRLFPRSPSRARARTCPTRVPKCCVFPGEVRTARETTVPARMELNRRGGARSSRTEPPTYCGVAPHLRGSTKTGLQRFPSWAAPARQSRSRSRPRHSAKASASLGARLAWRAHFFALRRALTEAFALATSKRAALLIVFA